MIICKEDYSFKKDEVVKLFLNVKWHSGNYPDLLYKALLNYPTVITVYDDDKLIGLVACMDDGCMNCYIHYVLVDSDYQSKGIGKLMLEKVKEKYKNYINVVLISYNTSISFYEKNGFSKTLDSIAMHL